MYSNENTLECLAEFCLPLWIIINCLISGAKVSAGSRAAWPKEASESLCISCPQLSSVTW